MEKFTVICFLVPTMVCAQTYNSHYTITEIGANYVPKMINNSNVVVGNYTNNGFIYTLSTGTISYLPHLSSFAQTQAAAINDSGNIVGQSEVPDPANPSSPIYRAYRYMASTGVSTELRVSPGSPTYAHGINKFNWVVGYSVGAQ